MKKPVWLTAIGLITLVIVIGQACQKMESREGSQRGPFGDPNSSGDGGSSTAGKLFFEDVVLPLISSQTSCKSCHDEPRNLSVGITPGPLSIYDYKRMRSWLLDNEKPEESFLMRKIRGLEAHMGGDRCQNFGYGGTPCKEFLDWWSREKGGNSTLLGEVEKMDGLGRIEGWAVDSSDTKKTVMVHLYLGGNKDSGTFLGATPANLTGPDKGFDGDHRFALNLPAQYHDGQGRAIHAYVEAPGGALHSLTGSGTMYAAYAPQALDYFEQSVRPAVQSCFQCHSFVAEYDEMFTLLLLPTPFAGGTSTENRIVRKARGLDNHGGGVRCANANSPPCNLIQQWWEREFAQ